MAHLFNLIREHVLWAIIALGLGAGLIGAYGRERHEGRKPDGNWWISRTCIIPFFAIVATWATEQFTLNNQQASLLSALLALMGYEAVRIIIEKAAARASATTLPPVEATPKPYASFVDSDAVGRPTAHVILTPGDGGAVEIAGSSLHQVYDQAAHDPLEPDMLDRLDELDRGKTHADRNTSPHPPVQPRK